MNNTKEQGIPDYTRSQYLAARAYGRAHGFKGASGGWIYDEGGVAVVQGWARFMQLVGIEQIENWVADRDAIMPEPGGNNDV